MAEKEPGAGPPPEVRRLWEEMERSGSRSARDGLILHYAPLVKFVASRVGSGLPSTVDQADLVSSGMFGLIGAIERFDREREVKFETYAIPRIRGAILDGLRALDWAPRSVRARAREADRVAASLETKLGRTPNDAEIADQMGVSPADLRQILSQVSFAALTALDEVSVGSGDGSRSLLDTLADPRDVDPSLGMDRAEVRALLSSALDALDERDRRVVVLYYFEGMTLSEIGEVLEVTESRICQVHARAVGRLRAALGGPDDD